MERLKKYFATILPFLKKNAIILLFLFLSLILNIFLLIQLNDNRADKQSEEKIYRLINPIEQQPIDSDFSENEAILHFNNLKPLLEKEIARSNAGKNIGFFLQDSQTGAWLGINERDGFVPASLLKIPILMAIFKKVERGEIKFNDTVKLTEDDLDKNSGDLYKKGAGYEISVWDLSEEMIVSSDNTAKKALRKLLTDSELNAVFVHIGIANPYQGTAESFVTPRGFSRFFKSLYFSTFLSPELSEKALDIATDTKVESLISAGIPPEIQVAHKYGERPDGISDCGIIYYPQNTYFLCIMTKNMEVPKSRDLISNLSKITYEFFSKRN